MENTTNLNMVKPAGTDHALISVINSNMDIIDGAVGALPSGSTLQGEIDSANEAIGTLANLTTTEKSNLVGAVNEVNNRVSEEKVLYDYNTKVPASGSTTYTLTDSYTKYHFVCFEFKYQQAGMTITIPSDFLSQTVSSFTIRNFLYMNSTYTGDVVISADTYGRIVISSGMSIDLSVRIMGICKK